MVHTQQAPHSRPFLSLLSCFMLAFVLGAASVSAQERTLGCAPNDIICRVSVGSDGTQGNEHSASARISADGRYIVFNSFASNLVVGDTNGQYDIFVYDRQTGTITCVSVKSDGTLGNSYSAGGYISADGRYVTFYSYASNLVVGDTNSQPDVFVHDRQTGVTARASVKSDGTQGNNISVSAAISADGNYVAFYSSATNLVDGDTNGETDVFVHDRQTGVTARVSVSSNGTQGNNTSSGATISADGRYVAFNSWASNLVDGDTNGQQDGFVHDRQTGVTTRISVRSDGTQGNNTSSGAAISADGRYVAFHSGASNLVDGDTNNTLDVFVRDRQTETTTRVSFSSDGTQGNATSWIPAISADGRYVAFSSTASNLVDSDTNAFQDIFVHDRQNGKTIRVSLSFDGTQGNNTSSGAAISADGRYITFSSIASNLVEGDTNDEEDVFFVDWQRVPIINNGNFSAPLGDGNGNWTAYSNTETGIVANINNGVLEFYRQPGSEQAVILQQTGVPISANTGLDVQLDMGNGGAVRKRFTVLVHDATFQDLQICSFWLAPNASPQTYQMHARATRDWTNTTISIYAATADGTPSYRLDNVSMSINPTNPAPARTICVNPNAPNPTAGADSANFISNGNFGVNSLTGGDNNWGTFFNIFAWISGGQLEMYNLPRTPPAGSGVVLQNTTNTVPVNTPFQVDFTLANTMPNPNWTRVAVLVHKRDFSDLHVCLFWLPPNTTAGTYMMRSYTTQTWDASNPLTLSLYPNPGFSNPPGGVIQVDNVVVRSRPTLDVNGTECYEPGALPAMIGGDTLLDLVPALLPTATGSPNPSGYVAPDVSAEIPVIGTPAAPIEAPSDEGTFSE